ncbi:hypothetical protein [Rhodopirellula sallentina]|uniref:hypothetical protein n=1 Tax=Rhodopirellula sallentina TaxID=1263869 RepID=UPI0011817F92|nr:hypothetical protein [Rhodopirellula sallentina]
MPKNASNNTTFYLSGATLLVFAALGISTVHSQAPGTPPLTPGTSSFDIDVPAAALLTDRGRQLAENLRNLKRTRSNLGDKHPTVPLIEEQIEDTIQQLQAWIPADTSEPTPFIPSQQSGSVTADVSQPPGMNEKDLRQLVLSLHRRIEQLELRVRNLERKNQR